MMAGIQEDIKKDLEMRAAAQEELAKPAGIKDGGMLDARFPVYFQTSVPQAIGIASAYFAALCARDLQSMATTLHYPYATFEGTEPLVFMSAKEFLDTPPPSVFTSTKLDSQLRPGTYDILDTMNVINFNPVNVTVELCYTRYRADGYRIGINQGIYAITNNDGRWAMQLSSVIFTPTEYIGIKYEDAVQAHLRQGRTAMAAFGDHDYAFLTHMGWGAGHRTSMKKTAGISGAPGATTFFLSGWANKPMEPYNAKGRKSRLAVMGPDGKPVIAPENDDPIAKYEHGLNSSNIVTASGQPGWFYAMAGGEVGHYGYTMDLASSRVLHAGPEKAHALGGYIRYTPDNVFISETRSVGIMIFDKEAGTWGNGGGFGQMMRRDRTNDDLG